MLIWKISVKRFPDNIFFLQNYATLQQNTPNFSDCSGIICYVYVYTPTALG